MHREPNQYNQWRILNSLEPLGLLEVNSIIGLPLRMYMGGFELGGFGQDRVSQKKYEYKIYDLTLWCTVYLEQGQCTRQKCIIFFIFHHQIRDKASFIVHPGIGVLRLTQYVCKINYVLNKKKLVLKAITQKFRNTYQYFPNFWCWLRLKISVHVTVQLYDDLNSLL